MFRPSYYDSITRCAAQRLHCAAHATSQPNRRSRIDSNREATSQPNRSRIDSNYYATNQPNRLRITPNRKATNQP
ncbi:MAG: hypothetical protein K8963_07575, partial [Proteobacteria bacterium]|nr:hypothetical protein [Pseudomonadota bacterium]